jgi:hypothetical protein
MPVKQTEPTGPRPPLANLVRVAVTVGNVTVPARYFQNVFHVLGQAALTPTSSQLNTFAAAFLTAYANAFKTLILVNNQVKQCDVTTLDGIGVKGIATGTTACTAAAPGLPPQCAVALSWVSYGYYRGGKPRTYLGAQPNAILINPFDSQIAPANATAIKTAGQGFLTAVNALTIGSVPIALGYVQYFKDYAMLTTPIFRAFSDVKVHERLDSQRRRSGRESTFGTV